MVRESILGNIINFMADIGVYDVVLPFLLVFTIIYAILEKTRVFGMEKIGKEEYTRKNINAMTAFVIAFFVIASAQLVEILTSVSSQVVILLLFSIFFLLLVGSFQKEGEGGVLDDPAWKARFMWIMFIGLIFIFLTALPAGNGQNWLEHSIDFISKYWSNTGVATLILLAFFVGVLYWITKTPEAKKE